MRALVVTDDIALANEITLVLKTIAVEEIKMARTTNEAVRYLRRFEPDLVLVDFDADTVNGTTASASILNERAVPLVLLVQPKDEMLVRSDRSLAALAYTTKPFDADRLKSSIDLAIARFEELAILRQEAADVKEAIESSKLVEKAKAALVRRFAISEIDAFRRLQQESAAQGRRLRDVAEAVVIADKML